MATGDSIAQLTAQMSTPIATNSATVDTRQTAIPHWVLDFDASTNESSIFPLIMPRQYAGGGLTVDIYFAMSSATSGDVDWDVSFERIGIVLDIDGDGFAAAQSIDNTTVSGTSGIAVKATVIFTDGAQMDSVAVGDTYRIKITRDAVSDTAAGDAELEGIDIRET